MEISSNITITNPGDYGSEFFTLTENKTETETGTETTTETTISKISDDPEINNDFNKGQNLIAF